MADDRPQDVDPAPDLGRPKRPPPTLDLEATEVTGAAADANRGGSATSAGTPPPAGPRTQRFGTAAISALTGAVAAGLVIAVVWLAGWPGQAVAPAVEPEADHAAVDALVARVADIEAKATAPSNAVPDPAVAGKIDTLEKSVASLREQLNASRGQADRLIAAINELKAAPRDAAAPPDLSAVNAKIAEVERTLSARVTEQTRQDAKPADDKPLRRVVAATLLELSVRVGEPYAAALTAAKALAPDANILKPLEPFAATGLPNPNKLSRDLLAELLPKAAPAPEGGAATTGTGIVDRLKGGAARLIRLERTDATDTTDRTAAVLRAAAAAQRNDIAGARRELMSLSGAERAAVQPGIDRLDARDAALAASRQFAVDALTALSKQ